MSGGGMSRPERLSLRDGLPVSSGGADFPYEGLFYCLKAFAGILPAERKLMADVNSHLQE